MAVINKNITEPELREMHDAIVAVQKQKGHDTQTAINTAQLLTYSVFRNLITSESVMRSIVNNARRVFSR